MSRNKIILLLLLISILLVNSISVAKAGLLVSDPFQCPSTPPDLPVYIVAPMITMYTATTLQLGLYSAANDHVVSHGYVVIKTPQGIWSKSFAPNSFISVTDPFTYTLEDKFEYNIQYFDKNEHLIADYHYITHPISPKAGTDIVHVEWYRKTWNHNYISVFHLRYPSGDYLRGASGEHAAPFKGGRTFITPRGKIINDSPGGITIHLYTYNDVRSKMHVAAKENWAALTDRNGRSYFMPAWSGSFTGDYRSWFFQNLKVVYDQKSDTLKADSLTSYNNGGRVITYYNASRQQIAQCKATHWTENMHCYIPSPSNDLYYVGYSGWWSPYNYIPIIVRQQRTPQSIYVQPVTYTATQETPETYKLTVVLHKPDVFTDSMGEFKYQLMGTSTIIDSMDSVEEGFLINNPMEYELPSGQYILQITATFYATTNMIDNMSITHYITLGGDH